MYAPRHDEAFLPMGKKRLGRFAPSALPHYEEMSYVSTGRNILKNENRIGGVILKTKNRF